MEDDWGYRTLAGQWCEGVLSYENARDLAEELLLFDFSQFLVAQNRVISVQVKESIRWRGDHINGAAVLVFPR